LKSFQEGGGGKGRIMEGDEPNQVTLYAYMEMSQGNSLYNYYKVITIFKK
jgi:hypothetical protein